MPADRLVLKNIGPISNADIQFGDLTVLVGPQATGKSIFLQFLKLVLDAGPIVGYLDEHGSDWEGSVPKFLELYLGEGMGRAWHPTHSEIRWQSQAVVLSNLLSSRKRGIERSLLMPAQRVLAFSRNGWF